MIKKLIIFLLLVYLVVIMPAFVMALEQREFTDHPIHDFSKLPITSYFSDNYPIFSRISMLLLFGEYEEQ